MKLRVIILVLIVVVAANSLSVAQFATKGFRFGVGTGLIVDDNIQYKSGVKPNLWGRGFLRWGWSERFESEVGAGYGSMESDLFDVKLMPIDFRLLYNLSSSDVFSPYVYGGIGAVNYEAKAKSTGPVSVSEWAGLAAAGGGVQISVGGGNALEVAAGYNLSSSDHLDGTKGTLLDGFYSLWISLSMGGEDANLDSDNDGLPNRLEKQLGTDAKNPDSDRDGLTDSEEYNTYRTSLLKSDTDGDGLSDGDEIRKLSTDPLKADTDGDGLTDAQEVNTYRTEPLKSDTDSDGLTDSEEVSTYKTNPLRLDSDGDGLPDGDEVQRYKTDPLKTDSDNGTVDDGAEIRRGSNPLDPKDDVVVEPKKEEPKKEELKPIVLRGSEFALGKATLSPQAEEKLQATLQTMKENPEIEIEIQGHTDDTGSRAFNMKLSERRAESVKIWLVAKGIEPARITTKGFGPDRPVVSNDTEQGRQLNRRVEIIRTK